MSRYANGYGVAAANTTNTTNGKAANGFAKSERHDERASQSGSEDGSTGSTVTSTKSTQTSTVRLYLLATTRSSVTLISFTEESSALISQTLNADGTPKRPMNAFMIFARRRRPQVSAENQAMRTGEISKILSKEWVSMPPSEKQFYLEQAKQLKETFNSKYPDYVYRRRPNNSRKRRRSDAAASARTAEQGALADGQHPDDMAGFELDGSPTDGGDDHLDGTLPPSAYQHPHPRDHHLSQHALVDHSKYGLAGGGGGGGHTHTRGPHPYPPPPDPPFRTTNGHHADARLSYSASGASDRMTQPMGNSPRMGPSGGSGGSVHYSPYGAQSSSSPFGTGGSDLLGSTHQGWQPRTERIGSGSSWLGGSPEATRLPAPISGPKVNGYSSTAASWPETANGGGAGNPSSSPANFFPTLNTPFYPGQPPHHPQFQSNTAAAPSPATTIPPLSSPPSHFEGLGGIPSNPLSREFGSSRSYASSSSNNNVTGAPHPFSLPSTRDSFSFTQRSLPPVQTGGYSHSQPSSSSSGSGHGHAPPVFWRD
ncbi:unnamed protein product [Cyclocybe aegerita]|uniref:HMG box domain-containing protein n=1 Tax=Cyclocybe aegerita TaxID=1973307 RepID=A0A8S0VUM2_CYCAE|nr:unnamed protein product [Cyclocybe aegerita]